MKNIKINFLYNLFYQVLTFVLPLVTTPYLSRVLGAEKTGIYSYSYSIAYYFVLFAMLGLNNYGNREIAKIRDNKYERSKLFWSIYGLQVCTSLTIIIVYSLCNLLFRNELINWIMLLYVMSSLFDINWFFWGMEEFKITVTRNTVIKLSSVMAILFFVKEEGDIYVYSLIMAGSMLLSPILLWPYLRKRIDWVKPSIGSIAIHLKPNLILFMPVVAVSLYKVMDKIMLGYMGTYSEVGLYDYAEKVIAIPICCVNALGTVMMPRMTNLVANNKTAVEKETIFRSMVFGTALATSMSFGLMGIADVFVPYFYGEGFSKCIVLFYILLPSCVFLAIANVIRTQYLIPHSMDKEYIISLIVGACINLMLNVILIPRFQSIGASIGTLVAEATVCSIQWHYVMKYIDLKRHIKDIAIIIVAGFIMALVVYFIPFVYNSVVTLYIKVVVGGIIFGTVMIMKYKIRIGEFFKRK